MILRHSQVFHPLNTKKPLPYFIGTPIIMDPPLFCLCGFNTQSGHHMGKSWLQFSLRVKKNFFFLDRNTSIVCSSDFHFYPLSMYRKASPKTVLFTQDRIFFHFQRSIWWLATKKVRTRTLKESLNWSLERAAPPSPRPRRETSKRKSMPRATLPPGLTRKCQWKRMTKVKGFKCQWGALWDALLLGVLCFLLEPTLHGSPSAVAIISFFMASVFCIFLTYIFHPFGRTFRVRLEMN